MKLKHIPMLGGYQKIGENHLGFQIKSHLEYLRVSLKVMPFLKLVWGEMTVERTKGTKIKVLFQGLHMTRDIFMLVNDLKFCILDTPFKIAF
jgi:hypothetical protein